MTNTDTFQHPLHLWTRMEQEAGTDGEYRLRVSASLPFGLFAFIQLPSQTVGLSLELPSESVPSIPYPRASAFRVRPQRLEDRTRVSVVLEDPIYKTLFGEMCWDLVRCVTQTASATHALRRMIQRIVLWRDLFVGTEREKRLSEAEQMGLFGELLFLERVIKDFNVPPQIALDAWRGPYGATHDFRLQSAYVEVKTLCEERSKCIEVSSLEQLTCPTEQALFLWVESIQWGGNEGRTLKQLVDELEWTLFREEALQKMFHLLLARAGYYYAYNEFYNSIKAQALEPILMQVSESFPSLQVGSVPEYVRTAQYSLDIVSIPTTHHVHPSKLASHMLADVSDV